MNWALVNEQVGYDAVAKIREILDSAYFMDSLYIDANGKKLDEDKRDALGQFYTPSDVCIKMLAKLDCDTLKGKAILDPTVGSGNLLIACLIAGGDIDKLYGNEYDADVIPTCRNRIKEAFKMLHGRYPTNEEFRQWQIHRGDALDDFCLREFGPDYRQKLEAHYLDAQHSLFPMLTKAQEEFLEKVD